MEIKEITRKYKTIIFDFDGVILDSNNIKRNAIQASVVGVLEEEEIVKFVNYFTRLNGVPREEKIAKYVPDNQYDYVLNRYESIIQHELREAALIPGVENFIHALNQADKNMIVLSGGTETEVKQLLSERGLEQYFKGVYGGPLKKEENLFRLELTEPVLYFGDSEVDFNVANNHGYEFIFVYGATNIKNWQARVQAWGNIESIRDFTDEAY